MGIALKEEDARRSVCLEGEIDITISTELKTTLITAISSGQPVQIDLGRVTDLDITAVQLLWSAAREAQTASTSFSAEHIQDAVRGAVRDMGFENFPMPLASEDEPRKSLPASAEVADDR